MTHPSLKSLPYAPNLINEREPLIDLFEEEDIITVLAELPGVDENEVIVNVAEKSITLTVKNKMKEYLKIIPLPTIINKDPVKYMYKNNILQVILEKIN